MKRTVVLLTLLVFSAGISCVQRKYVPTERQQYSSVYSKTKDSVVHLKVQRQNSSGYNAGSGFIVNADKKYICTAFHVIISNINSDLQLSTDTRIMVDLPSGRGVVRAELVAINPGRDLALLKLVDCSAKLTQVKISDKISIGEDIYILGFPLNYEILFTKGVVSGLDKELHVFGFGTFKRLFLSDANANPGASGSACFNSKGEVIGILQYSDPSARLSAGHTSKDIMEFIEDFM
jgi:S1-C subfamily serine protease